MGQPCLACQSKDLKAIDEALVSGVPSTQISTKFGIHERAIRRHRAQHLSPALTAIAVKREEKRGIGLADRLENLVTKIEDLVETSARSGAAGHLLAASRELRGCLELQAKLEGTLASQPSTTINVLSSPEISLLLTTLLQALDPFPEARIAASNAIDALPPGVPD